MPKLSPYIAISHAQLSKCLLYLIIIYWHDLRIKKWFSTLLRITCTRVEQFPIGVQQPSFFDPTGIEGGKTLLASLLRASCRFFFIMPSSDVIEI
jgi:hypothetical protein